MLYQFLLPNTEVIYIVINTQPQFLLKLTRNEGNEEEEKSSVGSICQHILRISTTQTA